MHGGYYFNGKKTIKKQEFFDTIYNTFTVEFWVSPKAKHKILNQSIVGVEGTKGQRYLMGPGFIDDENKAGMGVSVGINGISVLEHSKSYLPALLVFPTSLIGWNHVCIVYRDNTPYLYINGRFKKKGLRSKKKYVYPSGIFGGYQPYGFFWGSVEDLKLYDYAKNGNQILESFDKRTNEKEEGIVGEWFSSKIEILQEDALKSDIKFFSKGEDKKMEIGDSTIQPKLIAFYLPQFHEIGENNKWWGEGFTEWTNTRKAKPLFPGHYQPREPYNDYYYDLMHASAREWQAILAKRYGIYGFCYYHYWFKGKRLLEKPFEEVLRIGKPNLPFCLSWANEPWTRKWDGANHHILMPQEYGEKKDWKDHFDYLIKAFLDPRYIHLDGKPIFIIYRPGNIPKCEEMLEYWNHLAIQSGLKGIYFVKTLNIFELPNVNGFDAGIEFEPHFTISHGNCNNPYKVIKSYNNRFKKSVCDYNTVWNCILKRVPDESEKIFPGAFIDWDNSPRRGREGGVFFGANPEKFAAYLENQIRRTKELYKSEFLFINAWNEWAEGTYLEPDKRFGFRYLEAVRTAIINNNISI